MQKQTQKQVLVPAARQQATGPVEIDASLLQFVSGGAPKTTWSEPQALAATLSTQAPKTTW